jgi:hypothetical protein
MVQKEYKRVDSMSWDQLMVYLKKRAARKEQEITSSDEEDEPVTNERSPDGPLPQSRFYSVYAGRRRAAIAWRVEVNAAGVKCHLRCFEREEEAARLADRALFYLLGSAAKLNFPHETPGELEPHLAAKIDAQPRRKKRLAKEEGEEEEEEPALPAEITTDHKDAGKMRAVEDEVEHEEDEGEAGPSVRLASESDARKYIGVCSNSRSLATPWRTQICFKSQQIYLQTFADKTMAARLVDRALYYVHGPDALLNFPDEEPGQLELDLAAKIDERLRAIGANKEAWGRKRRRMNSTEDNEAATSRPSEANETPATKERKLSSDRHLSPQHHHPLKYSMS